ncbi:MAG: AsmA-like C-terminal domain-containing protein [Deltaproteobacteria bacterium]|nr:AsmA-like C-terminal domain-containing protein [Deltaproteobacteria bacterium]
MKKRSTLRILFLLLLLFLVSGAGAFYYVANADLQPLLQAELSSALRCPVTVGQVRLRFFPIPALDLSDIAIDAPGEAIENFRAPHLHLRPSLLSLLRGQLRFNEITLQSPSLRIDLGRLKTELNAAPRSGGNAAGRVRLDTVRLRQGAISIVHSGDDRFPAPLLFPNVNGRLVLKGGRPGSFMIDGEGVLEEKTVPFSGKLTWTDDEALPWRRETLGVRFKLRRCPASILARLIPSFSAAAQLAGDFDLTLEGRGSPADGVVFEFGFKTRDGVVALPGLMPAPRPLPATVLRAVWTSSEEAERLSSLELDLNGLRIQGAARLERRQEGSWLRAELASAPQRLAAVAELLGSKELLPQGTIELKSCAFDGPLSALAGLAGDLSPLRAELRLKEIETRFSTLNLLMQGDAALTLEGNRLRLDAGPWLLNGAEGELSATLEHLSRQQTPFRLEAAGRLPLAALLPPQEAARFVAQGLLPFRIQGAGTLQQLRLSLESDLAGVGAAFSDLALKRAGAPGKLACSLALDRERWRLEAASVSGGPALIEAGGDGSLGKPRDFRLQFRIPELDLGNLAGMGLKTGRMKTEGKVSVTAFLTGAPEGPPQLKGELELRDAGLRGLPMVADLSAINGRILWSPAGLSAERLSARIGDSPLEVVAGSVENFAAPVIQLHVKGKRVRADELIFPSDQAYLYDLDGRLRIDRDELRFEQVDVALGGGTKATVRGYVRNFSAPETWLHITSEEALVDEVIALWQRSTPKPKEPPRRKEVRLLIDMKAGKGSIGGFEFSSAQGQLRLRDGRIVIHPLDFQAGPGRGEGQVIVDPRPAGPAQLRISGHVEDLDAATVTRQVLARESIATGSLSGDFYMECRAEKNFLESSLGRFNGQLRDGVLRKFQVLAKVFSLLNVSQLLTMKLPDMSLEGMPFTTISGDTTLNQGILTTENLLVDSTSMKLSLVGNHDLKNDRIDALLGVQPLGAVDTVMTRIPIAGWLLGGEEKALITAHFRLAGTSADPRVEAIPATSLSDKALGIFRRLFQLPGKMITDPVKIIGGQGKKAP